MRVRLQFIATAISLLAIVAGIACKRLLPQYWTDWLAYAVALFWLVEMIMSFVLEHFGAHTGKQALEGRHFVRTYLIAKGIKLLLTVAFIIVGISAMGNEPPDPPIAFACTSVVLYLLHLAGETYVVTRETAKAKHKP